MAQAHQNVHLSKQAQDLLAATDVTGSPQLPHTHLVLASRLSPHPMGTYVDGTGHAIATG